MEFNKPLENCVRILGFSICIFSAASPSFADYTGRYCELEGARTSSGDKVNGECWFYSDEYGELEGAKTSSGERVKGECYRYSDDYAELEGAKTSSGEKVKGECYFY